MSALGTKALAVAPMFAISEKRISASKLLHILVAQRTCTLRN